VLRGEREREREKSRKKSANYLFKSIVIIMSAPTGKYYYSFCFMSL
jgi:hypothetical protein